MKTDKGGLGNCILCIETDNIAFSGFNQLVLDNEKHKRWMSLLFLQVFTIEILGATLEEAC
jgi:hypothetical protein